MKKKGIWILLFCVVWMQCFGFSINYCQCYGAHPGDYSCCSEQEHSHANTPSDSKQKTSQFATHWCLDIELEGFQFLCTTKSQIALPSNLLDIIPRKFITFHKYQTFTNTSYCYGIPPLLQSCILLT